MREVPLYMGFNTGIPGAPMSASFALDLSEVGITEHSHEKGKINCLTYKLNGCVGRCFAHAAKFSLLSKSA